MRDPSEVVSVLADKRTGTYYDASRAAYVLFVGDGEQGHALGCISASLPETVRKTVEHRMWSAWLAGEPAELIAATEP